ncbi:MAG TPA: DUF2470 domain-containing protein, partial [Mycobacterium sp.]|nr:DUF2470 domain-containing protein [Mycobacterium sp.]
MPRTETAVPTTAERIRSACAKADGALLAVDGVPAVATPVQHLLDDGSFAIAVPIADTVPAGVPAMLELTDHAGLPLRKPVRSLVWVRGRLESVEPAAVPALLDLIAATDPQSA